MIPLQIIDTFNLFITIVIVTVLVLIYFLYIGIRIRSRGTVITTSFCITVQIFVLIVFKLFIFRDFDLF
ncbi:hypothetical protein EFN55_06770 [Leuconostoc citreum]|nr:hypothetical protein [Leuconostoc citreum]